MEHKPLPLQLYEYFILPSREDYVFQWGEGGEHDCRIWLGAVYEEGEQDIPTLIPCDSHTQAKDLSVQRVVYHLAHPDVPFRGTHPDHLHTNCGNPHCVHPDHLVLDLPDEWEETPQGTTVPKFTVGGRTRKFVDENTLYRAYELYSYHGQSLDHIKETLNIPFSRATLHRRLEEMKLCLNQ